MRFKNVHSIAAGSFCAVQHLDARNATCTEISGNNKQIATRGNRGIECFVTLIEPVLWVVFRSMSAIKRPLMSNTVKCDSQPTANTADLSWNKQAMMHSQSKMHHQSPIDIDEAATFRLLITVIGLTLLRSHTMTLPLLLEETTTSQTLLMARAVMGA